MPKLIRMLAALMLIACTGNSGCMIRMNPGPLGTRSEMQLKIKTFTTNLDDEDPAVREKAAYGLVNVFADVPYYNAEDMQSEIINVSPKLYHIITSDQNTNVRVAAIRAIDRILQGVMSKTSEVVPVLDSVIRGVDNPTEVRLAAIEAITHFAKWTDVGRENVLAEMLRDESPKIRAGALEGLETSRIAKETLTPLVIKCLDDESAPVRAQAASTLGNFYNQYPGSGLPTPPEEVLKALTKALDDYDPEVRFVAAVSLGLLNANEERILPILIGALDKPEWQFDAIRALERIGPKAAGAVPRLIQILKLSANEPSISELIRTLDPGVDFLEYLKEHYPDSLFLADLEKEGVESIKVVSGISDERSIEMYWANGLKGNIYPGDSYVFLHASAVYTSGSPLMSRLYFYDEIRALAALALGEIGPEPGVVDALIESINDKESTMRFVALLALKNFPDKARKALPLIIERLKDEDDEVRQSAEYAIAEFGADAADAVPALISAFNDKQPWEKAAVFSALARIGPKAKAALPIINEILDNADISNKNLYGDLYEHAAQALINIGPESGDRESFLKELLKHKNPYVRGAAVKALGELGPKSVPVMLKLIGDDDSYVRESLLETLGKVGEQSAEVAGYISGRLLDEDLNIRYKAADVITQMGPKAKGAVPGIVKILESANANNGMLPAAKNFKQDASSKQTIDLCVEALGAIGPGAADAVEVLNALLSYGQPDTRAHVIYALVNIGPVAAESIPAIIDNLTDSQGNVRKAAAYALGVFGPAAIDAVPSLIRLLSDADDGVRWNAATALGLIGPGGEEAIEALQKVADEDANGEVRKAAKGAVGKIGGA